MSKFVIFLLFIAIQCGSRMQACTTPFCLPKNYQTYRVIPTNAWELSDELPDEQLANRLLWQEESSRNISILEIDEVVYQWSLTQLKQLTTSRKTKNRFAQWLVTDGKEVRDYLVIAKEVEYVRQEIIDPWYYPYEGDSVSTILTRLEQDVRARLKGSLHSRYLLQLARLLTTTKQYGEIISLWKTETIREYLLRKMISGYAAGAYYADKQYKKALKMFIENGDIDSMIWCFKALNLPYDKLDIIEQLAETPTNFVLVASHLQDYIRKVEKNLEDGYKDCSKEIERIIQLSHRYAQQVPAKQQAMWLYTEAYAYWLKQEESSEVADFWSMLQGFQTSGKCVDKAHYRIRYMKSFRPISVKEDIEFKEARPILYLNMAAVASLFNSRNMNATANRSNWSTIMSYLKSHSSFLGLKQDRFTILLPSGLPDYSFEMVNNEQVKKVKVNRPKALCFDYLQLKEAFGLELETEVIPDTQNPDDF